MNFKKLLNIFCTIEVGPQVILANWIWIIGIRIKYSLRPLYTFMLKIRVEMINTISLIITNWDYGKYTLFTENIFHLHKTQEYLLRIYVSFLFEQCKYIKNVFFMLPFSFRATDGAPDLEQIVIDSSIN